MFLFNRPRILTVIFAFMLTALTASAQDIVTLKFVSFPKLLNPELIELNTGNGKKITIEMPTNNLSPEYKVHKSAKWVLGKTNTNGQGPPKFNIYGETESLNSTNQIILAIRNGEKDKDGLDLLAIDCNGGNGFGGGKYFFINLSDMDVSGTVGEVEFSLKPQDHTIIAPIPMKLDEKRSSLYTKALFNKGEDNKPFYSSTWRYNKKARNLVFFYQEPDDTRLQMHVIRNYM